MDDTLKLLCLLSHKQLEIYAISSLKYAQNVKLS